MIGKAPCREPKEYECHFRKRISALVNAAEDGCTVLFNPSEKSWDCPCHGGRFDVSGKVLNGPPTKDLEAVVISYDL